MRLLWIALSFWLRFFRASLVFFEFRQVDLFSEQQQRLVKGARTHRLENMPMPFGHGDHHPVIGTLEMTRQVVA